MTNHKLSQEERDALTEDERKLAEPAEKYGTAVGIQMPIDVTSLLKTIAGLRIENDMDMSMEKEEIDACKWLLEAERKKVERLERKLGKHAYLGEKPNLIVERETRND